MYVNDMGGIYYKIIQTSITVLSSYPKIIVLPAAKVRIICSCKTNGVYSWLIVLFPVNSYLPQSSVVKFLHLSQAYK